MHIRLGLIVMLLGLTGSTASLQEASQKPGVPPIRNFVRVNEQFCTGGQPRPEHLAKLKEEGVKAIINLRTPVEYRAAEEEEAVKNLGLRYVNIPIVFTDPKDEQATEFLKVTDDPANRPAFIHCAATIWTTVSRTEAKLFPRSLVHCSGVSGSTASNIRVSAQRV